MITLPLMTLGPHFTLMTDDSWCSDDYLDDGGPEVVPENMPDPWMAR